MNARYQVITDIPRSIFRAYDIRGISPDELNPDGMYTIALAIGCWLHEIGETSVLIARDGRLTSSALMLALSQGLCDSGLKVITIGAVPTPVLYFATKTLPVTSGLMVTGSHNPAEYNGLKMVIQGKTLAEEDIQSLYARIQAKQFYFAEGLLERYPKIISDYTAAIKARIQIIRSLTVVIDCGNGITGMMAESILRQLGVRVIPLFTEVDGHFPNHHPDPTDASTLVTLQETVLQYQADCGLAFDGDGDRLGIVTNEGEVIAADCILTLFADHLLKAHPGATVIFDVKCTDALPEVIQQRGGVGIRWKTGHSLIKAKMLEHKAILAGEMSGHLFFADNWYGFDDGFYSGLRFLELLSLSNKTAGDLFGDLPYRINTPELKIPVDESLKFAMIERCQTEMILPNATLNTIDGVRAEFETGWALIRASNTTPCLIVRFEAVSTRALSAIKSEFLAALQALFPDFPAMGVITNQRALL